MMSSLPSWSASATAIARGPSSWNGGDSGTGRVLRHEAAGAVLDEHRDRLAGVAGHGEVGPAVAVEVADGHRHRARAHGHGLRQGEAAGAVAVQDRDRVGAAVSDRQVELAVAVEVGGHDGAGVQSRRSRSWRRPACRYPGRAGPRWCCRCGSPVTTSSLPSRLKSPTATECGESPTVNTAGAAELRRHRQRGRRREHQNGERHDDCRDRACLRTCHAHR